MDQTTLESLVLRVEALEQALNLNSPRNGNSNWQRVVGMFGDNEFMRQVDAEGRKIRETERANAQMEPAAE
jgi:hypothetical protein